MKVRFSAPALLGALFALAPMYVATPAASADGRLGYTSPGVQTWYVPVGVSQVTIDALGAPAPPTACWRSRSRASASSAMASTVTVSA